MKKNNAKPLVIIQCYEDRQATLPLRKPDNVTNGNALHNHQIQSPSKKEATDSPPPPPPMPIANGHTNGHKSNTTALPITSTHNSIPLINGNHNHVEAYQKDLKAPNFRKNGTLNRTPTPDYNNTIDNSSIIKSKDDKAELESLESFKLKNPLNASPKPPPNYFVKAPNGTTTMKKLTRPVSVTIGEYAYGGAGRREPTKLEFLNGDKPDGPLVDVDDSSISNRLQSELVLTLSRSNLRKKTEALDDVNR